MAKGHMSLNRLVMSCYGELLGYIDYALGLAKVDPTFQ